MTTDDTDNIAEILRRFDQLPDDAVVPTRVTAAVHGVSQRTVRRTYKSVQLSPNRKGQRVGTIRAMSRAEK
jgi:hypothetical protein